MKHYAFLVIFALGFFNLFAQQDYFIFIQSENQIPFYAKVNNKHYDASTIGHLTVPRLKDSTYVFTIGFPEKQSREQLFRINMDKRDRGFLLKKSNEKNWVLFDWKTPESIRAEIKSMYDQENEASITRRNDSFARLMASVVNDSDVLYTSIVKAEPPKVKNNKDLVKQQVREKPAENNGNADKIPDSLFVKTETFKKQSSIDSAGKEIQRVNMDKESMVRPSDSAITSTSKAGTPIARDTTDIMINKTGVENKQVNDKDSLSAANNKNTVVSDTGYKKDNTGIDSLAAGKVENKNEHKPAITKLKEENIKNGKELIFIENVSLNVMDTVTVVIPFDKETIPKDSIQNKTRSDKLNNDTARNIQSEIKAVKTEDSSAKKPIEKVVADTLVNAKKDTDTMVNVKKTNTVTEKKPVKVNTACREFAKESDLDKLRVKMLGDNNIDDRVNTARKAFRVKCYSYIQIKDLSKLFITDEGRYKLFDAAYPYISDTDNFPLLEELLTDSYYINRFKAMLRL